MPALAANMKLTGERNFTLRNSAVLVMLHKKKKIQDLTPDDIIGVYFTVGENCQLEYKKAHSRHFKNPNTAVVSERQKVCYGKRLHFTVCD